MINVIMLVYSSSEKVIDMTKRAIQSLYDSEPFHFNMIVVESSENRVDYDVENIIYFKGEFNYNAAINMCNNYLDEESEWLIITNNDVRFERGWFSKILDVYDERTDIESFSPKCPFLYNTYYKDHFLGSEDAYKVSHKVTECLMGWCLVMRMRVFKTLYPFDETFDMFYQDNDYAEQLKLNGIKHALVRDSIVSHLGSLTVGEREFDKQKKMDEDFEKFKNKYPNYEDN